MTRLCSKCGWPMFPIKATTGVHGWKSNYKFAHKTEDPILLYKCEKCGELENGFSMRIKVADEGSK